MKWLLLPVFFLVASWAQAGGNCLSEGRAFADGDSVVFADFDNDGDQDILVSSSEATPKWSFEFLYWMENSGGRDPVFTRHALVQTEILRITALPIDLNGDGRMDFVAAASDFSWFENNDTRPTSFTKHIIFNENMLMTIGAADLNSDGRKDLVCMVQENLSYSKPWQLTWFAVSGSNPVQLTSHTLGIYEAGSAVELTDLDHDGDTDVVVSTTNATLWLENDGAASPTFTQHLISTVWAHGVRAADMNSDGRMDLVLGFNWLENLGGSPPTFKSHNYYTPNPPLEVDLPDMHMVLADLTLDGYPDILIDGTWFESSGGSSPVFTRHDYPVPVSPPFNSRNPAVFDADGDGDLDLIISNLLAVFSGSNKLNFFRNLAKDRNAVSSVIWQKFY